MTPPPFPLADLDTPSLLLDLPLVRENLAAMRDHLAAHGKAGRPHVKTHKSSRVALLQLEFGAQGFAVAKVSEAERLASAGVGNVLVTGPLATRQKVARLAHLHRHGVSVLAVIDHPMQIELWRAELEGLVGPLPVLVDLDVGLRRHGAPPAAAREIARAIAAEPRLILRGVQAYAGHVQHLEGWQERREASLGALAPARELIGHVRSIEPTATVLSTSGTGTFDIDVEIPEVTELQVGSYLFMDEQYRAVGAKHGGAFDHFAEALRVLTTVVTTCDPDHVVVDAGMKALYKDGPPPRVHTPGYEHLRYEWFGDEYGKLTSEGGALPPVGTRLELVVSHCDPTVNLHDAYYVLREDKIIDRWPIDLRGCVQ